MKIAVASEEKTQEGKISQRGGRAPYYLIFENKKFIRAIKNPFAIGSGGAGWSVAYMLADEKVNLVIAGKIGPNMRFALKEKGIKFKEKDGKKVEEIIKKI